MTDRELMKKVLSFLLTRRIGAESLILALQDRLAQPEQEPVAYMGTDIEGNPNKFRLNPFGGCVPLYEKPQSVKVWDAEGYGALCQELEGWKAKAQRKPLTDGDLADCTPVGARIVEVEGERTRVSMTRQQLHEFANNVIEAAHGIKE